MFRRRYIQQASSLQERLAAAAVRNHELCTNLDYLIELAKESRTTIRALLFIVRALEDLQAHLDQIEQMPLPASRQPAVTAASVH